MLNNNKNKIKNQKLIQIKYKIQNQMDNNLDFYYFYIKRINDLQKILKIV